VLLVALLASACAQRAVVVPAEPELLGGTRQLTFEGARSGEGYFSADGRELVFQSEREPGNPFYQIYRMDLRTGDVRRVSPGHGKTTCAWIHPDGRRVLFASTHHDPEARAKQQAELEFRASGQTRRYSWDYDPAYELYAADATNGSTLQLTHAQGYDAEGSYSPDGQWIAFASNRHAFTDELVPEESARFERDPAVAVEIYLMRADGSELRRLTRIPGYDGGPFFSADGARILWRRFALDGATAELYSMALDGTDVRQLTQLSAMSWAPFPHPSGAYVIFATNLHGFENFELYLVDTAGQRAPVRVTESPGFDGLPAFSPDGARLVWTSNRAANDRSQLFIASWNHEEALRRLALAPTAATTAALAPPPGAAAIRADDLRRHVEALTADEMEGRATGTVGEERATQYVADVFAGLGLEPAGDEGSFFQHFEFTSGVRLGPANTLGVEAEPYRHEFAVDDAWRPLAFSRVGESGSAPVVFSGYGIVAPAEGEWPAYDSYAGLEVEGSWVLVLRFLPEELAPGQRQHLNRYSGLRYKAMLARERGALGLLIVTGPHSRVKDPLVPLRVDVALAGTSLFALSVSTEVVSALLAPSGQALASLQAALDEGVPEPGFVVPRVALQASVDLEQERRSGRNVVARLAVDGPPQAAVIIGAHVDHLGRGAGSSLARDADRDAVHPGADDNASGVAGLLEIAQWLAANDGGLVREVIFAAWSGEEIGLLGSNRYASDLPSPDPHGSDTDRTLSAYLNMDMIGRMQNEVVFHGLGSSSVWAGELERRNVPVGLPLSAQQDSYLPTDATSFYLMGVPVLSAFTGSHAEYHTPDDTAEKLDYAAAARIATLVGAIARSLAQSPDIPDYIAMQVPRSGSMRGGLRVYLGTVPDYARTDVLGVALSGVAQGGPADKASVRAGDVIVQLAGQSVENIYDYTYALEGLAVGEPVEIHLVREGERVVLEITPESRQ
jgi:Tol biopolymer transport system component